MKEKEVIKDSSIQLTIDFDADTINCISEKNCITFNNQMYLYKRQAIVINIYDCKKKVEEKKSKKIIEYIINNAKRF